MAVSSLVAAPPTDASPSLPYANGTASISPRVSVNDVAPASSDSDLSDVSDIVPATSAQRSRPSSSSTPALDAEDAESDLSDGGDSGLASADDDDDADIANTASVLGEELPSRSTSEESRRPLKRKAGIEDDEDVLNNPELYGLRRSGRARPTLKVIQSDSDDDDSDVQPVPRKRHKSTPHVQAAARPLDLSVQNSFASASDDDEYATSKRHRASQKSRRHRAAPTATAPSHAEVRFSTRKAARISNYNEDDGDDFEAELEDDVTPNYWAAAPEDDAPAIDAVLNHRPRTDNSLDVLNPGRDDYEYYVKWQGKAHYHATWERNATLAQCRGIRRLENYFRKIVLTDNHMMHDEDVPPEDKEKWSLDRERDTDALEDYIKVERVIGQRDDHDGNPEYFVKWRGLYYDACTWEDAALVSRIAQSEIDRYLDRTSKLPLSDKHESNPATRSRFDRIKDQPDYIKFGKLREFQIKGLNFLAYNWCNSKNVILADEMGLGKTVQTVSFMNWLRHDRRQQGPFLVVVPLSTMPAWAETFDNWTPDLNYVVYNGNEASRNIIRQYELLVHGNPAKPKFHALLTTYEYILVDSSFLSQIKWQFMAVDEAHRLKNRESQLYAKLVEFKAPSRLLITGTPMQNTLGELSSLMDFLMPGVVQIEENMDLQSEEAGQKLSELTQAISPYMLRRTKNKVENDLPPKTEKIIRVELSDVQLEYYKNILTRNYAALNAGAKGQKQSLLNIMMELKKASNHPFMFPNAEDRIVGTSDRREDILKGLITSSGKMMLLDQLLSKLQKDNHRVLIFSQMVRMLDILSDYLRLRGYQYQRLDGTIAAGPRRMAIDHFNAPGSSDFCFLLSTRAGGLGINLMTADTVILFDSDWNPQADLQAMARAHRIGQTRPVSIYRLVSKETVEEEVLERARNKLMLEFITIQRGVTDKEAKEMSDKMARAGKSVTEPTSSEDISRILKRRGQKMFEQSGNQRKLEELDIDSVLANAEEHQTDQPEGIAADGGEEFLRSFEYMDVKVDLEWDEIIPKDQLEEIKANEKRKADEEYLAEVIEQNAPRKRKQADDERAERAAKKRARELAALEADAEESDSATTKDPSRPLSEREIRNLIRSFQRYGSLDDRGEEIIEDSRLGLRTRQLLVDTINELTELAHRLLKEEQERVEALERAQNKVITKKDRKAVLFDFHGVKRINAETIVERPGEMRMLKEQTSQAANFQSFRVNGALKPAAYSTPWGAREDGMLCIGIVRHGYGAWTQIRDDVNLELGDKLFLEEHRIEKKEERRQGEEKNAKSPGAVHLVRRADYLLSVLKERTSNGQNLAAKRAVENHHRNSKKASNRAPDARNGSVSASPGPTPRKNVRDGDRPRHRSGEDRALVNGHGGATSEGRHRSSNDHARSHSSANHRRRSTEQHSSNGVNGPAGANGDVAKHRALIGMVFQPINGSLQRVRRATKELIVDKAQRANVLRDELMTIGAFIRGLVKDAAVTEVLETDLWEHVATYWPNPGTPSSKVRNMYDRIAAAAVTTPAAPTAAATSANPPSTASPHVSTAQPSSSTPAPASMSGSASATATVAAPTAGATSLPATTSGSAPSSTKDSLAAVQPSASQKSAPNLAAALASAPADTVTLPLPNAIAPSSEQPPPTEPKPAVSRVA